MARWEPASRPDVIPLDKRGAAHGCATELNEGARRAPVGQPQPLAEVMHDGFEHARLEPAVALLVHRMPGGQVVRHYPPCRVRADDPMQAVKHLTQALVPLWGLFGHEGPIRGHQGPFVVTHISGIGFAFHTASVASSIQSA
jgi:hypothetical protein